MTLYPIFHSTWIRIFTDDKSNDIHSFIHQDLCPKWGKQVPYMLPLLHPEDIDKDIILGNLANYFLLYTCCWYVYSISSHVW